MECNSSASLNREEKSRKYVVLGLALLRSLLLQSVVATSISDVLWIAI